MFLVCCTLIVIWGQKIKTIQMFFQEGKQIYLWMFFLKLTVSISSIPLCLAFTVPLRKEVHFESSVNSYLNICEKKIVYLKINLQ